MWLPLTRPPLATQPATQACALTGNQTSTPLVHRPMRNSLSSTSQGYMLTFFFFFLIFYLFTFSKRGREGEREGEKHQCERDTSIGYLSHNPNWGPSPQPRHVPWSGIEPATFWFTGWHSIHWATPARAQYSPLMQYIYWGTFFPHYLKQFLNSLILMPFSVSAIFLFHSFENFLSEETTKERSLRVR